MSKVIYACSRSRPFEPADKRRLAAICRALKPGDLASPPEHRVWAADRVAWAVMDSGPTLEDRDGSLLLGRLYGESGDWSEPLADRPDGSFVVFRENAEFVEVLSDPAASRTVWYHLNDELFVASTSQRALAMYLRGFEFDERVVPWLLSTGSLGPEYSWDRRFRRLPPDSSVTLDRGSWSLDVCRAAVRFSERKRSPEEHRRLLEEDIRRTIATVGDLDFGDWVLPLSGGCDSRAILCFLIGAGAKPRTITWGLERSIDEPGNDAYV